jgi:hypothetical protein
LIRLAGYFTLTQSLVAGAAFAGPLVHVPEWGTLEYAQCNFGRRIGERVSAACQQARADVWTVVFSGDGVSGTMSLTASPNVSPPDPNLNCGTTNACRSDPAGAYMITNIEGTFTDTNIGITNASITGLIPISPTNERDPLFDPLVPTSLSYVDYTNEAMPGGGLSY